MSAEDEPNPAADVRVGTLELFSDLVFVFAVTQLTTVLVNDRTWVGLGHVLLMFGMLWWVYFAGDDARALAALRATPDERRPARALAAFFYAQIPMLLGVVTVAAAVKTTLPNPMAVATEGQAWLLAGGAAGFLTGDLWFRAVLGIARSIWRILATPLLPATAVIGLTLSINAQLAALAAVLVVTLSLESIGAHSAVDGAV